MKTKTERELRDAPMTINAELGRRAAAKVVGMLEDRVKASMRAVIEENWLERRQQRLFTASIAGVLLTCETGDADYKQLVDSLDALRKIGAMLELAKIGTECDIPKLGENVTLPLYEMWHEVFNSTRSKIVIDQ